MGWVYKFAARTDGIKNFTKVIYDGDRSTSDQYDVSVTFLPTIDDFTVSFYISNHQLGVAGYCQYWHYDNKSDALKTYNQIKEIINTFVDQINYERPPMSNIGPIFRKALEPIDPGKKESSGYYFYNWYIATGEHADDWRTTIYGNRYPEKHMPTINWNWTNHSEPSKEIETKGSNSREKTFQFRYSAENNPISPNSPVKRSKKPQNRRIPSFETHQSRIFLPPANG